MNWHEDILGKMVGIALLLFCAGSLVWAVGEYRNLKRISKPKKKQLTSNKYG